MPRGHHTKSLIKSYKINIQQFLVIGYGKKGMRSGESDIMTEIRYISVHICKSDSLVEN